MNGKLETHLQNISYFIETEDKIVTYKWVSKALKVHTNTAKQLLYAFAKHPPIDGKLVVTYVVAGELRDEQGLGIRLVNADDLEETKKQFNKVTSVHVYSIQRGTSVTGADIYNADDSFKLTSDDQVFRSIQCEEPIERRDIKVVAVPSVSPKKNVITSNSGKSQEKVENKSAPPEDKDKKKSPPKRSSPRKTSAKKSEIQKPGSDRNKSIGALFQKQAEKKKEQVQKAPATKTESKTVPPPKVEVTRTDKKEEQTTEVKPSSKNKRKKSSNIKESATKRRKRIQVQEDSEASDEDSCEDERYPSPEPEMEAPAVIESEEEEVIPATPVVKGRKRVRKQKDVTYEGDDGYIHTKKEYVFESCSDDECSEPPAKLADKTQDTKKADTSQDVKQEERNKTPRGPKEKTSPAKEEKSQQSAKGGSKSSKAAPKSKSNGVDSKQRSITTFFSKKN